MCVPEEAASNALAHSGASRLVFRWMPALKGGLDGITIEIEDDGQGFDHQKPSSGQGFVDWVAVARAVQGTVQILPRDEGGTCVRLRVPLAFKSTESIQN